MAEEVTTAEPTTTPEPAPAANPAPAGTPAPEVKTEGQPAYTPVDWSKINLPKDFGDVSDGLKDFVSDLKLSPENTQKLVDYYQKNVVDADAAHIQQTIDGWEKESISKFGNEGIEVAKKAYNTFATPELKELFNATGLGSNPAVIAMFKAIGDKITEGKLVLGDSAPPKKTPGELLFAKSLQR